MLEQSTQDKIQHLLSSEDIQNINMALVLLESFLEQQPQLLTSMFPTDDYWSLFSSYPQNVYVGISILVLMHRYDHPYAINLTTLDIQGKNIHIPDEIVELKNLRSLSLTGNQLTEVPKVILQLQQLEYLDLSNNHLSELPNELFDLIELQYLDISDNRILLISPVIAKLTNLRYLHIENNRGYPPRSILSLPHLIELDIVYSKNIRFKHWKDRLKRRNIYKESIKLILFAFPIIAPLLYQFFLENPTVPTSKIILFIGSLIAGSLLGFYSLIPKCRPAEMEAFFQKITNYIDNNSLDSLLMQVQTQRYSRNLVFNMLLAGLKKSNRDLEEIRYVMKGEKRYGVYLFKKYKLWSFLTNILILIEGGIIVYDQQFAIFALVPVAFILNIYCYIQFHNIDPLCEEYAQRLLKIIKERNDSYGWPSS
mgnify:CR=1 FL=1